MRFSWVLVGWIGASLTGTAAVAQPVTASGADPQLTHVLATLEPGTALRVGLQDTSQVEGTLETLRGSRLLLRTFDERSADLQLADIVRVEERGVSKARGSFLGAVILGTAGVVAGLFAGILTMDNPDNSDLAVSSATFGLFGLGLGAVVGRHLDPGRPSGWHQRYPYTFRD